ncbi:MAG: protein-disulfide reductase DsbD [Legionella sp.]|uniref:protein-disulfide reductase DsbD n=1 Tax=Legionella sp. TaxID=459 RepID=UPI0039E2B173
MKKWLLFLVCFFITFIGNTTPLPAYEIFKVGVNQVDPNTFTLNFQIKPNYFLYSDRIQLSTVDNVVQLGPLRLPKTTKKIDKQGHQYDVYRKQVSIPISVLGNKPGKTQLLLSYQGCADDGFCYPPEEKTIRLIINNGLALAQVSIQEDTNKTRPTAQKQVETHFSKIFSNQNWAMILLTFYGFGLLLSFTPCILPMVPVLSGIIVGHGKEITTRKAFFLSLSYVLSMSITYAIAGAIVALIGANLQISMQSPWSIGIFSLIFALLALSMFGFYEFKLPNAWQTKIGNTSSNQRGGHYIGAAIMGCLSTLILSPCVTAPLIGVLTYIAESKNILLGSLTLFILGLGMGTPLLLIGTSAGKWLPETGRWMNTIKNIFGVLFLAVAISLISRIAPILSMGLWACLLIFSGIFSGALTYSITNREKFNQSVGLVLLAYGFLVLIGTSKGATNPLQPLTATAQTATAPTKTYQEQTLANIKHEITTARGKPVMLDFYADWCTACKVMDATTFKDARVQNILRHFKVIKVDVTANNANDKAILNFFDVIAPPTFVFFDAQGQEMDELKSVGERSADEFLMTLNQIKPEA